MSRTNPSPAAAAASVAGAEHPDDHQQLQRPLAAVAAEGAGEGEGAAGAGAAAGQPPPTQPPPRERKDEVSVEFVEARETFAEEAPKHQQQLHEEGQHGGGEGEEGEGEEEEEEAHGGGEEDDNENDDYDQAHTPVGLGAGGIISPAAAHAHAHAAAGPGHAHPPRGDPALANTLGFVCDICERDPCACGLVDARRGTFFEGSPPETKRAGKPHLPHKSHKAVAGVGGWRPANKTDYRGHHRPPHRDPHHAQVASRDADFVGDVPHGPFGTRSGKKEAAGASSSSGAGAGAGGGNEGEEEGGGEGVAAPARAAPLSALDAEVRPPVVPPPGLKGRPSHVGGARLPELEVARDPFERKGAPSSPAGAGGRGHVQGGHKHRGQRHQDFTTLG